MKCPFAPPHSQSSASKRRGPLSNEPNAMREWGEGCLIWFCKKFIISIPEKSKSLSVMARLVKLHCFLSYFNCVTWKMEKAKMGNVMGKTIYTQISSRGSKVLTKNACQSKFKARAFYIERLLRQHLHWFCWLSFLLTSISKYGKKDTPSALSHIKDIYHFLRFRLQLPEQWPFYEYH